MKPKELRQAYQKTKESNGRSGTESQTCCFYAELHAILGGAATTTPPLSMDSDDGVLSAMPEDFADGEDEEEEDELEESTQYTILPDSQDLFITLTEIPSQPNEAGEGTSVQQLEKSVNVSGDGTEILQGHLHEALLEESCARVLLFRGASKEIRNYNSQTAFQAPAAISGPLILLPGASQAIQISGTSGAAPTSGTGGVAPTSCTAGMPPTSGTVREATIANLRYPAFSTDPWCRSIGTDPLCSTVSTAMSKSNLGRCTWMQNHSTLATVGAVPTDIGVAIIAGNFELAEIIKTHKESDVGNVPSPGSTGASPFLATSLQPYTEKPRRAELNTVHKARPHAELPPVLSLRNPPP
ncbi:SH3 and multiple ankyrin repeat domains protein 3 [Chelonia mydas]|uniref:SH3 and multiple ankyrin repeat domains protein 3 n=1 Tax=Chelonia mydas TaxID=8469 RepID=M7AVA4_CHEMY|nr:SH3 and multiple ankyrin repeat domains protein 3 [Chelonia mydas]